MQFLVSRLRVMLSMFLFTCFCLQEVTSEGEGSKQIGMDMYTFCEALGPEEVRAYRNRRKITPTFFESSVSPQREWFQNPTKSSSGRDTSNAALFEAGALLAVESLFKGGAWVGAGADAVVIAAPLFVFCTTADNSLKKTTNSPGAEVHAYLGRTSSDFPLPYNNVGVDWFLVRWCKCTSPGADCTMSFRAGHKCQFGAAPGHWYTSKREVCGHNQVHTFQVHRK